MARKPNYAFERNSRARAKAEKREAKRQAKLAKTEVNSVESGTEPDGETPTGDDAANDGT